MIDGYVWFVAGGRLVEDPKVVVLPMPHRRGSGQ
jgi:hypothetical protein